MSKEINLASEYRMIEAVNSGDLERLHEIFAPDVVDHDAAPNQTQGSAGFVVFFRQFREAFPDLHVKIEHLIADDNNVALAVTVTGTNLGPFQGSAPTGRKIQIRGVQIARFTEDGRMIERWGSSDEFGLFQQLALATQGSVIHNGEAMVTTTASLLAATKDSSVKHLVLAADIEELPTVKLLPGQSLRSEGRRRTLSFSPGSDGLQLSASNLVSNVHLHTSPERRALFNDSSVPDLGRIDLRDISTVGRVQLIARGELRLGHIEIRGLDILSANTVSEAERPQAYGVHVLQGALTIWNMHADTDAVLTANLIGLSVGRSGAPVLGSGILVSGGGENGGRLKVQRLETGAVYTDGQIPPGTPDQISGAVFTCFSAHVDVVVNDGPVVTYGANDMALDNWGSVDRWIAKEKVTTLGTSGIGFVNFGTIGELRVEGPIETYGEGARGFNVYAGTVATAKFDRIVTHADGAVGVQISQPIGDLFVHRGIETFGGIGNSLVKGQVKQLSAIPLSIMPNGAAHSIIIEGGLKANKPGIIPLEQHGSVEVITIAGGFKAADASGASGN